MGMFDTANPPPRLTPQQQYAQTAADEAAYAEARKRQEPTHNGTLINSAPSEQQLAEKGLGPQEAGPADVPLYPGTKDFSEGGEDSADGTQGQLGAAANMFGTANFNNGPGNVIQPEGSNYAPVGGAEGKSDWEDTFRTKPREIEAAIMEGAKAEGDLGNAKADFYKRTQQAQQQELSVLAARRAQRQQQIDQQQQQLQAATERYSNDLSEGGYFWKNPAGILASFGAALVTLSTGQSNDHSIGVKLVNEAINADFQRRKQAADYGIAGMQNNLNSYRQIAGDKDMGDKMALAESYRVAGMELERISAQFQGPIAKAKAAAIAKDLNAQRQVLMMNMYKGDIYQPVQPIDPRILAAKKAGAAGLPEGVGYTPFAGSGGASGATPGTAAAGGTAGSNPGVGPSSQPGMGSGGPTNPAMDQMLKQTINISPQESADWEKRAPGSTRQIAAARLNIAREAWNQSGGNMKTFFAKRAEMETKAEEGAAKISVAMQPVVGKVNGIRRLQGDIEIMENLGKRIYGNASDGAMDKLMSTGSDAVFGKATMAKWRDQMLAMKDTDSANSSKYDREIQQTENAVERFKQLLSGSQNSYIHDKSGGNVSAPENERMQEYLRKGWRGIKGFAENESKLAQSEVSNALNAGGTPYAAILYRIGSGVSSPRLDSNGIPRPGDISPSGAKGAIENKTDERQRNIQKAIKNASRRSDDKKEIFNP